MIGVMMEYRKRLDVGHAAEPDTLLPGRMPPADMLFILGVGIGAVINDQVGALDQAEDILVGLARHMLGIGHVAQRLAAEIEAVSRGEVGMIQRRGEQPDGAVAYGDMISGQETNP